MIDVALLGIIRRWHLRDKVTLREIAKRLGISRNTVRRYLRSETTEPAYAERQTAGCPDPYAHQLAGWLKTEAAKSRKQRRSLKQLHEKLVDLGFRESYDRVAAFARQWREGQTEWVNSARKRTVVGVKPLGRTQTTYNLRVAGYHTFFAGEQLAYVHNAGGRQVHVAVACLEIPGQSHQTS